MPLIASWPRANVESASWKETADATMVEASDGRGLNERVVSRCSSGMGVLPSSQRCSSMGRGVRGSSDRIHSAQKVDEGRIAPWQDGQYSGAPRGRPVAERALKRFWSSPEAISLEETPSCTEIGPVEAR